MNNYSPEDEEAERNENKMKLNNCEQTGPVMDVYELGGTDSETVSDVHMKGGGGGGI